MQRAEAEYRKYRNIAPIGGVARLWAVLGDRKSIGKVGERFGIVYYVMGRCSQWCEVETNEGTQAELKS